MHPDRFLTQSLRADPRSAAVTKILAAAIAAVEPGVAVRRHLEIAGSRILLGGQEIDLASIRHIFAIGFGKAAAPMCAAAADVLGEQLTGGIVLTKDGHLGERLPPVFEQFEARHPEPDLRGLRATQRIIGLLEAAGESDFVLFLISGGGSALLCAPAAGVSLDELQHLTRALLASGAAIDEINTVRKHLSRVKGGGLARLAYPARSAALILSDVVGDRLDVIASGPTVPDPTDFSQAIAVLERYGLPPPAALLSGARGEAAETPKPGDPIFARVTNVLVGNNRLAAEAALDLAARLGFQTRLLGNEMTGPAAAAGGWLAGLADGMPAPACWIAGGETTVQLGPSSGKGGRCQELALAAVRGLAGKMRTLLVSLATDGGDGPTDAAGAVVTGETLARAQSLGLDPDAFLARHDSYNFFEPLGDLLKPGPTRTNVNDLALLVRW